VRKVTRFAALFIAFVITLIGSMMAITGPASAVPGLPDTCVTSASSWDLGEINSWTPPGGNDALKSVVGRSFTPVDDAGVAGSSQFYGATGYEWFGGNDGLGLRFSGDTDTNVATGSPEEVCASGSFIYSMMSGIASIGWNFSLTLNSLASSALELSQSAEIITWLGDNVIQPFQQGQDLNNDGTGDGGGLNDFWIIGIAAVVVVSVGYSVVLIAKNRLKESGKSVVWTVGAIVVGSTLLANPLLLPNAAQKGIELVGNNLSSLAATVVSGWVNDGETATMCRLDDSKVNYSEGAKINVDGEAVKLTSVPVREITCSFWEATSLRAFRDAQFGTGDPVLSTSPDVSALAVTIPGLADQPKAGDLVAYTLATRNLSPAEQVWADAKAKADGVSVDSDSVQLPLKGGFGTSKNQYLSGNELAVFPAAGVNAGYDIPAGTGTYSVGHADRYERLVTEMSGQPRRVFEQYTGISALAFASTVENSASMLFSSVASTLSVLFFALLSLMYQLMLGFMLLLLPIPLIGMALPFRTGSKVAKDFFGNLGENVILASMAMVFTVLSLVFTVVLPGRIPILSTQPLLMGVAGVVGSIFLIMVWRRVAKGFRTKAGQAGNYNTNSGWDVGGKVGQGVGTVTKTVGKAAIVVGAAAATGGVAGAAAASTMMAKGAANAVVSPGSNSQGVQNVIGASLNTQINDAKTSMGIGGGSAASEARAGRAARQVSDVASLSTGNPSIATPDVPATTAAAMTSAATAMGRAASAMEKDITVVTDGGNANAGVSYENDNGVPIKDKRHGATAPEPRRVENQEPAAARPARSNSAPEPVRIEAAAAVPAQPPVSQSRVPVPAGSEASVPAASEAPAPIADSERP
jgi:hypothetical protein